MTIKLYSYPDSIKFDDMENRVVDTSKMKYLHDMDMELTLQKRYSKKWERHIIDFPPELNARLEDIIYEEVPHYNTFLYGTPKFIFEIEIDGKKHYFHNNPWFVGEVFVNGTWGS